MWPMGLLYLMVSVHVKSKLYWPMEKNLCIGIVCFITLFISIHILESLWECRFKGEIGQIP